MNRYLKPDEIECRVAKIFDSGISILLYKTARTDMMILDEIYGEHGWSCDYKEIKGNLFCGISVKTEHGWVTKWDCGIESRSDGAGNEKKGEASDAFKRAGTKFGIGRELYTAPKLIWVNDSDVEIKEVHGKKTTYDTFSVKSIDYADGKIISIEIINDRTKRVVFSSVNSAKDQCTKLSNELNLDDAWKKKLWNDSGKKWSNLLITLKSMKEDRDLDSAADVGFSKTENVQKVFGGEK